MNNSGLINRDNKHFKQLETAKKALEEAINYSGSDDQIEHQLYKRAIDEYESFRYWLMMEY